MSNCTRETSRPWWPIDNNNNDDRTCDKGKTDITACLPVAWRRLSVSTTGGNRVRNSTWPTRNQSRPLTNTIPDSCLLQVQPTSEGCKCSETQSWNCPTAWKHLDEPIRRELTPGDWAFLFLGADFLWKPRGDCDVEKKNVSSSLQKHCSDAPSFHSEASATTCMCQSSCSCCHRIDW